MRYTHWLAIASLALMTGVAGYGLHARFAAAPPQISLQELQQRIATLEARIAEPRLSSVAYVGASRSPLSLGRPMPHVTTPADAGLAPRMSIGDRPPPPEEIARRQMLRRTQLDADFRREQVDGRWAKQAESALLTAASSDAIVQSGIVPDAITTECRGKTCRVVTRFGSGSDVEGWMNAYILGAADTLARSETVLSRRADGVIELSIYGRKP